MVSKVDLRKLLSPAKDSLTFQAKVAINGRTVNVSCLADTGADGYILLDESIAISMIKGLGLRTIRLPHACPITGFDGSQAEPITHTVKLTLMIDGHVQTRQPMLVTEIGNQDVILGVTVDEALLRDLAMRGLIEDGGSLAWKQTWQVVGNTSAESPTILISPLFSLQL